MLLGALSRPRRPHAPHPHAMPDRSGPRPAAERTPHRTVRRTWCSTSHHHGGGARRAARGRARSAPVGAAASGGASRAAAGGCSTPCAPPSAATNAAQAGPVPEPLDALEPRAKGGERRPPHPRPHAERTGPARAPRTASQIPPSKICGRWRGQLTRTSFGGSLCRARAWGSARARTTTPLHPRTPAERIGARVGARPAS